MRRILASVLLPILLSSPVYAERPWSEIRGRNVAVFGAEPPARLRDVAVELEQFRSVLGRLIPGAAQPQPVPTDVYVFADLDAMRPFVPLYQGKPSTLGGYCHCGGSDEPSFIAVARSRQLDSASIVYHEYTHLLLHNAIRAVPVWLNEGLAEYYSTFSLRANGREAQVGRPIDRHLEALQEGFIPLSQLLAVDRSSPLYNESSRRSIFYAESWALTHFLLLGRPNGGALIDRYVETYGAGAPPDEALASATGVALPDLEAGLRRYVARGVFDAVTYSLTDRVDVGEPSAARTLPPAEAQARLGTIQMWVGRVEEAARRIEGAAASGADVAEAQLALGLLRLGQHRETDAAPALQKAVALAPGDFTAQYVYGLTLLRGGGQPDPQNGWPADSARAARDALARAVAVRGDSAAALAWLAYADLEIDDDLAGAREATRRAVTLAPGRLDYQLQLAEVDMRLGNAAEARRLLTALARTTRDEDVPRRAKALLAVIDRR